MELEPGTRFHSNAWFAQGSLPAISVAPGGIGFQSRREKAMPSISTNRSSRHTSATA